MNANIAKIAGKKLSEKKKGFKMGAIKDSFGKRLISEFEGYNTFRSADVINQKEYIDINIVEEEDKHTTSRTHQQAVVKKPRAKAKQYTGIKKKQNKITDMDPKQQLLSNIKESILRKDSNGILSAPFAIKKKEDEGMGSKNTFARVDSDYFKKKTKANILKNNI